MSNKPTSFCHVPEKRRAMSGNLHGIRSISLGVSAISAGFVVGGGSVGILAPLSVALVAIGATQIAVGVGQVITYTAMAHKANKVAKAYEQTKGKAVYQAELAEQRADNQELSNLVKAVSKELAGSDVKFDAKKLKEYLKHEIVHVVTQRGGHLSDPNDYDLVALKTALVTDLKSAAIGRQTNALRTKLDKGSLESNVAAAVGRVCAPIPAAQPQPIPTPAPQQTHVARIHAQRAAQQAQGAAVGY